MIMCVLVLDVCVYSVGMLLFWWNVLLSEWLMCV